MELNATAKVIVGMLAARPRSGYEIKQLVDHSARFFWAASYGQIYPELKKLAAAGLATGTDASQGGRRRTVYKLTGEGERVAREWIESPAKVFELRDEGLLKLFFAGSIEPGRAAEIARERAEHARGVAAELAQLEAVVAAEASGDGADYQPDRGSTTVLRCGIEFNEWLAEWFERAAPELESDTGGTRTGTGGKGAD